MLKCCLYFCGPSHTGHESRVSVYCQHRELTDH